MKVASILGIASALAVAGCAGDGLHGEPPPSRLPVVVDTDAGLDDAIALLYLATSPEVDLRTVTVTGTGLAHCFPGARNVVGLLELAGSGEVPVSCGPEQPISTAAAFHPFPDDSRASPTDATPMPGGSVPGHWTTAQRPNCSSSPCKAGGARHAHHARTADERRRCVAARRWPRRRISSGSW